MARSAAITGGAASPSAWPPARQLQPAPAPLGRSRGDLRWPSVGRLVHRSAGPAVLRRPEASLGSQAVACRNQPDEHRAQDHPKDDAWQRSNAHDLVDEPVQVNQRTGEHVARQPDQDATLGRGVARTRLLVRMRASYQPAFRWGPAMWLLVEPAHFVMGRRQLLGIRQRAKTPRPTGDREGTSRPAATGAAAAAGAKGAT